MGISATLLGQVLIGWILVYVITSFFLVKQFMLPKAVFLVAIVLIPFIPLTPVYLIVLVVLGVRYTHSDAN